MRQADPVILDATRRILREVADPQARRAGEDPRARRAAAWQALDGAGLPRAWVPEAAGGAGAGLVEGFAILTLAGEAALDVPLAETLLAGWLAAAAGLSVPDGALAPAGLGDDLIALGADGRLTGQAAGVPFAREADRLAVLGRRASGEGVVAIVERAACAVTARDNLAGEPRDRVRFDGALPSALAPASPELSDRLLAMGAVARACQMSGALQAILARSVAYAGERVAFDRPIGRFQAIQHALARLAGEAAIALAASGSAADALAAEPGEADEDGAFLEVASAKIRVGEAAAAGAAIAHQVHGAIGFALEHPLHHYTRRLWAWRDDFGSESAWAVRLGARVARRGADALWPVLAAR
ncbi:MAG TPA: acyl-CoA dehydrogenase family protein [Kofleriaceae bacterium]|nr:acyl-CoA dehydrogenase family protein [Kofleriaceae bacterium]